MKTLLHFLGANPYILLFLVVGLAVWTGRLSIKGYELGMVAAAIVVGWPRQHRQAFGKGSGKG
jgi:putative transport protein